MPTDNKQALYPIRDVAQITGVNPVTLRAWQRRYGLVVPQRTAKGHRLYSQADIDNIRQITTWLDKGIAISKVKPLLSNEAEVTTSIQAETGAFWQQQITALNQSLFSLNSQKLQQQLSQLEQEYPYRIRQQSLYQPWFSQLSQSLAQQLDGQVLGQWLTQELFLRLGQRRFNAQFKRQACIGIWDDDPICQWQSLIYAIELTILGVKVQLFSDINSTQLQLLLNRTEIAHLLVVAGSYEQALAQLAHLSSQLECQYFYIGEGPSSPAMVIIEELATLVDTLPKGIKAK